MIYFIIGTVIFIVSILSLLYTLKTYLSNNIIVEKQIKRFIYGGLEILILGILLVVTSMLGVGSLNMDLKTTYIILISVVAILVYISLVYLWYLLSNKIYRKISNKKDLKKGSFKYKGITVYALIYAFGLFFYLNYSVMFLIIHIF